MNDKELAKINKLLTKAKESDEKPKMEFSKVWLISCMCVTVVFVGLSYVLAFMDKNPVESLSSTVITVLCAVDGVSFVGYNLQNCIRAWSLNKKGE